MQAAKLLSFRPARSCVSERRRRGVGRGRVLLNALVLLAAADCPAGADHASAAHDPSGRAQGHAFRKTNSPFPDHDLGMSLRLRAELARQNTQILHAAGADQPGEFLGIDHGWRKAGRVTIHLHRTSPEETKETLQHLHFLGPE